MVDARKPAAAGVSYPAEREVLLERLHELLGDPAARDGHEPAAPARGLVVPHAMTGASGTVAAAGWRRIAASPAHVKRVVLLGPAHHVPFGGIAAPFADAFATPLGIVPVDRLAIESLRRFPQLAVNDLPHEQEPSLEAQLPFVHAVLEGVPVLPLIVGELGDDEAAEVLDAIWDDATLVVVSTDLSRYFDATSARKLDEETARAIEKLEAVGIREERACGHGALRALILVAKARKMHATRLALAHSGDRSGESDEVVGYGAFVFEEGPR